MPDDQILKKLKEGHQFIVRAIEEMHQVSRNYAQAKSEMPGFQSVLLNYFGGQNIDLLDPLTRKEGWSRDQMKLLEFFSEDLKNIKVKILTFFDEYSGDSGSSMKKNFSSDFQQFSEEIQTRLKMEENYLFSFFE